MKIIATLVLCGLCGFFELHSSAVAAAAVAPASVRPVGQALTLSDVAGKTLFSCAAPEGFIFGIRYTHSVALSPVEDWFSVNNGVIFLEKTVYSDFGAGLPHDPGPGRRMRMVDGRIVISGYHTALPSFDLRVGRVAGHTLLLPQPSEQAVVAWGSTGHAVLCETAQTHGQGDEKFCEVRLDALATPGSAVTFTVRQGTDFERGDRDK